LLQRLEAQPHFGYSHLVISSFASGADGESAPFVRYEISSAYFISLVLTIRATVCENKSGSSRPLNLYSNSDR